MNEAAMVEMVSELMVGSRETEVSRAVLADGASSVRYSREAAIRRTAEDCGVDVELVRAAVERVEDEERTLDLERERARADRSRAARGGT